MRDNSFLGIKYSAQDLKNAINDLDNNKYKNWQTNKEGYQYNIESPKGNLYGPKRIYECLYKNMTGNKKETPIFGSTETLRTHLKNTGCKIVQKDFEIDFEKIIKINPFLGIIPSPQRNTAEWKICHDSHKEFNKLLDYIAEDFNLEKISSGWCMGSCVYEHLWGQLKSKDKIANPFSISIFYVSDDKLVVTLELKGDSIKKGKNKKYSHQQILN